MELNSILEKVRDNGKFSSFADIVVTSFAYHFTQKMHDDYPDAASLMSRGHAYDLKSNVFDRLSMIFMMKNQMMVMNTFEFLGEMEAIERLNISEKNMSIKYQILTSTNF